MASLDELARKYTVVEEGALGHLRRLISSWGTLADFSFADLLLFVPVTGEEGFRFVVLAQVRATTSQTLYQEDLVGRVVDDVERPLVARCWRLEQIIDGEVNTPTGERARMQCIPIRWNGRMLGVLTREASPSVRRRPGELERKYVEIFDKFARMISEGEFPFATEDSTPPELLPRVGDGVIVLDPGARVDYVSPNAVSALHRLGVFTNAEGMRLGEVGFDDSAVRSAFAFAVPVTEEIDRGTDVSVVVRCIPLLKHAKVDGAVVLVRDVSDLRVRDRLLLSKDAAIREVHHRVKNNLQTISSLLRLQARRTPSPEGRAAIEESVRRIRSIALVHETLSRAPSEQVGFDEIVRPLVRMVEEGLLSEERPIRIEVRGEAGELPARVATPLAVVLTELLQNAVDHAFPPEGSDLRLQRPGHVLVELNNQGGQLIVRVRDDGVGLPPGFNIDTSQGLGLTIVRALVTTEMGGTIEMRTEGGALVELRVPLATSAA